MQRRISLLVIAAIALLAGRADAKPMMTDLATVRSEAKIVVIGQVRAVSGGQGYVVDVEKTIRGAVQPGPLPVKGSPDGTVIAGPVRVVVFVDGQNRYRWMGRLIAGPSLEKGVIQLNGFYDTNAHLVSPGLLSLKQLERYLKTGKLQQRYDGRLVFADPQGGLSPSSQRFEVRYDALAGTAQLRGLQVACLQGAPQVWGLAWGRFELSLSSSCAATSTTSAGSNTWRRLSFEGRFTGLSSKTGAIEVDVYPDYPFLYEPEFRRFAVDPTIVGVERTVRVSLSDGSQWTWKVGSELVDPRGQAHAAGGTSMRHQSTTVAGGVRQTLSEDRYHFGNGISLVVSPSASAVSSGGAPSSVIQLVDSGKLQRCTLVDPAKPDRSCTLQQLQPVFMR